MSHYLHAALLQMTSFLTIRLLPYAVYATLARAVRLRTRIALVIAYLVVPGLACALGAGKIMPFVGVGSAYYIIVGLGANGLTHLLASNYLTRGAIFVLTCFLFVLLPGILFGDAAGSALLLIGCELALKMYSYVVETSRPWERTARPAEYLFFLLVDPTILYTDRGRQSIGDAGVSGYVRAAAGAVLMFLNLAFLWPLGSYLGATPHPLWHGVLGGAARVAYGTARVLGLYAAHSSLASIDIGLMRQLGWTVSERYCFALFAASPLDFWRRWNIYVRLWFEAYVFLPLAWHRGLKTPRAVRQVIAILATFAASAFVHDVFAFAPHQDMADLQKPTKFFCSAICLAAAWLVANAIIVRIKTRIPIHAPIRLDGFAVFCGRLCIFGALVAAAVAWG